MNLLAKPLLKTLLALATLAMFTTGGSRLHADGGKVLLAEVVGPYRLTLFVSPTPLVAGPLDISMLVQDAQTGRVIDDATIDLTLTPVDAESALVPPLRRRASHAQATNKLLQAAKLQLPAAGRWRVDLRICGADASLAGSSPATAETSFLIAAAPASQRLPVALLAIVVPGLACGLFLLRERLVRQQSRGDGNVDQVRPPH